MLGLGQAMHPTWCMAERVGVEPTIPLLAGYTISNRAPSASRASLRFKHLPQHGLPAEALAQAGGEGGMCSVASLPPPSFGRRTNSPPKVGEGFSSH